MGDRLAMVETLMDVARRHHRYTYADYVGLEMYSSTKHEFLDGQIYAMASGSEDHSALAVKSLAGRVAVASLKTELVIDEIYRGSGVR
jgi:hypothetical protein